MVQLFSSEITTDRQNYFRVRSCACLTKYGEDFLLAYPIKGFPIHVLYRLYARNYLISYLLYGLFCSFVFFGIL